ncbi:MAG TPA: DUF397 domain-containing protein [Pseudonocardiaceae bacterium]|nr:DUF397 domain-containing protein [Pseudonocardiaceae bacterium]
MATAPETDGIVWHTSSYSGGSGDCVEVVTMPDVVLVRDSKHRNGPALTVPAATWHAFLQGLTH